MRILHILNGDCAFDGWRQNDFPGEVLVWRENYLYGTMPETTDLTVFNRLRAEELHRAAPDRAADEIFAELQAMHSAWCCSMRMLKRSNLPFLPPI
jgi:hypothetical protein